LIKKCIKIDKQLAEYNNKFEKYPYHDLLVLLESSKQNLLIDDQLNKIGRIFIVNHNQIVSISKEFEQFISKTHEGCMKLGKIQSDNK
jgi:hypothetical protein